MLGETPADVPFPLGWRGTETDTLTETGRPTGATTEGDPGVHLLHLAVTSWGLPGPNGTLWDMGTSLLLELGRQHQQACPPLGGVACFSPSYWAGR